MYWWTLCRIIDFQGILVQPSYWLFVASWFHIISQTFLLLLNQATKNSTIDKHPSDCFLSYVRKIIPYFNTMTNLYFNPNISDEFKLIYFDNHYHQFQYLFKQCILFCVNHIQCPELFTGCMKTWTKQHIIKFGMSWNNTFLLK